MTWLFDTDGTYWSAVAVLWGLLIAAVPVIIIATIVHTVMENRERRDGKRGR